MADARAGRSPRHPGNPYVVDDDASIVSRVAERVVVSRAAERAVAESFIEAAAHAPAILLLTGETGIGKTTLWLDTIHKVRSTRTVLVSQPAEQDAGTPYVGLADLLHAHLPRLGELLAPPDFAVLSEAVMHGSGTSPALRHVVHRAVSGLAEEKPVLIAVDDWQWFDDASRRLVEDLLARLAQERVGVLVAERTQLGGPPPPDLYRAGHLLHSFRLELPPIPAQALGDLISERLGLALPGQVLQAVHRTSGGNPLFACELVREWVRRGRPNEVPLPSSLVTLLAASLEDVGLPTQQVLDAVATVGRVTVAQLQLLLGRPVRAELADAVRRRVLDIGDSGTIRFCHPMHAAVVSESIPWERRAELHRLASQVVVDGVDRARHLALSTAGMDAAVAAVAEDAATQAAERGAPSTAADLAGHARRLTPSEDRDALYRRGLAVGAYLDSCGRFDEAIREFEAVLSAPDAGGHRAVALLARAALEDDVEGRCWLTRSALTYDPSDALAARAHNQLAWYEGLLGLSLAAGSAHAQRAVLAAERASDAREKTIAHGRLAFLAAVAGADWPEPVGQEAGVDDPAVPIDDHPLTMAGLRQMWRGRLADAGRILELQYTRAIRTGDDSARSFLLVHLVDLAVRRGCGADVSRYAEERRRVAAYQRRYGDVLSFVVDGLAAVYGDSADTARALAGQGLRLAGAGGTLAAELRARHVLGLAELLDQDPQAAWSAIEPAIRLIRVHGVGEPGFVPVVPEAVAALVLLGDLPEAHKAVALLDGAAAADHPWAGAARRRCAGLLALAEGKTDEAAAESSAARDAFDEIGAGFDAARTTHELGAALRRGGGRAAAHRVFQDAGARFANIGAHPWAARAVSEQARAGGGRSTGRLLTAGEESVAALAAQGRANREIAAELYISVATVEANLTRVYRKLGVSSRTQLARLWASGRSLSTDS